MDSSGKVVEGARSRARWLIALVSAILPLLIGQQIAATASQDLGAAADLPNIIGLQASETGEAGSFRWSNERVDITLQPLGWPLYTTLYVQGVRPEGAPEALVGAEANGRGLGVQTIPRSPSILEYRLPAASLLSINPTLNLTSTLFQPQGDARRLGIVYYRLEQRSGPGPALPSTWPAIPLITSVLLAYLASKGLVSLLRRPDHVGAQRLSAPLVVAIVWGIGIGVLNAVARPWLVFYSWYFIVPPIIVLLLLPWARRLREHEVDEGKEAVSDTQPTLEREQAIAVALTIAALALMAWHVLAPSEPLGDNPTHNISWGVSFYTALPLPLQAAGIVIVIASLLWAWLAPISATQDSTAGSRFISRIPFFLFPLVGMAAFAMFPVAYSEGDSDEFDSRIPIGAIWRERELLDFYLKVRLWRLLNGILNLPSHVYQVVAVIAGGIYMAGASLVGRTLGRSRTDTLIILGALAATGNILIFFRYVESYALVGAASIFVLWACWRYTEGNLSFGAVGALATLAPLFHGSALWWGPMVVVGWLLRARLFPSAQRWSLALRDLREGVFVGLAMIILLVSIMLFDGYDWERFLLGLEEMGGRDARTMLPLFTTQTPFEHYPFFSWTHLGAVIQEQLLTAPMALITLSIVCALAWKSVRHIARHNPPVITLMVGAAAMFFYSITWNPDLGPRSDWDLLALPALPVTLLATYLLLQLPHGKARRVALAAYLSLSGVHAAGWVILHVLNIRY